MKHWMRIPVRSAVLALALSLASPAIAQELPGESAPEAPVMLLKLASGEALWGRIAGHDSERIAFQLLDNGGIVRMPWKRLEPGQSSQLLEEFGYVDHTGDELTVEAERLELDDGTEIIGHIVSRTENEIYVKTSERLVAVPKRRIQGAVTTVVVPALDVFTREELYRTGVDELDPKDANSQFQLAQYCERILDFQHAAQHYKEAVALDPARASSLNPHILRVEDKALNQAQLDYLYTIDSMRARGQFDQALRALEAFAQKWPDTKLKADAERKKKQVLKSRENTIRELVVGRWYTWSVRLIEQQARKEGVTLEASLTFLEEQLPEALLAAVTKELQRTVGQSVQPEEVKKFWDERKRGRFKRASYGQGTWLLGEAAALKEYGKEKPKTEDKPKTAAEKQRDELAAKLDRFQNNQRMTATKKAAAGRKEGEESEEEIFWRTWTSFSRTQWLLAHYVENGGDFRVLKEEMSNCPDCGGTGAREMINTGSARSNPQGQGGQGANSAGFVLIDCPLCHRIGRIRRITYW